MLADHESELIEFHQWHDDYLKRRSNLQSPGDVVAAWDAARQYWLRRALGVVPPECAREIEKLLSSGHWSM